MTCSFSGSDKFYLEFRHEYFLAAWIAASLLSQACGIWKLNWSCAGFAHLSFVRFVSISALLHWDVTRGALILK